MTLQISRIHDLANEQMAREYGPLKNSTGNPTHKSSQNHHMRGSKSRPTLTLRDADHEAKRIKRIHHWTASEKQDLVDIISMFCVNHTSDSKIDWGKIYIQFLKKFDWVEGVSKDTLKTCYYKYIKNIILTGGNDGSNDKAIGAGTVWGKQEQYMESNGMVPMKKQKHQ